VRAEQAVAEHGGEAADEQGPPVVDEVNVRVTDTE
jgi:hypothetical protein